MDSQSYVPSSATEYGLFCCLLHHHRFGTALMSGPSQVEMTAFRTITADLHISRAHLRTQPLEDSQIITFGSSCATRSIPREECLLPYLQREAAKAKQFLLSLGIQKTFSFPVDGVSNIIFPIKEVMHLIATNAQIEKRFWNYFRKNCNSCSITSTKAKS